jgi:hypothetical protein
MGVRDVPKETIASSYSLDYILPIKILQYHLNIAAFPFRSCSDKMI